MNWYKLSQIEDFQIPQIPISGTFYHGSTYNSDSGDFDNLSSDYSEWQAIWVCPEEYAAEMFACDWNLDQGIPVVFQVAVNLKNAASIRPYDMEIWKELMDSMGFSDIRQLIPYLKQHGCDGWITTGSIGTDAYSDIAIFASRIDIKMAKMKEDDQWTPYMNLRDLNVKLRNV